MTTEEIESKKKTICETQTKEVAEMIGHLIFDPPMNPELLDRLLRYVDSTCQVVFWQAYQVGMQDGVDTFTKN